MHKIHWVILLLALPIFLVLFVAYDYFHGPLGGMVVVIDAGHGGSDPGSHGIFGSGVTIQEDEYVYDVACRLKVHVESLGGTAVMTAQDSKTGCAFDTRPPNDGIPSDKNEVFAIDGAVVDASSAGLAKRTDFANKVLAENWWRRVVFISIHFDAIGVADLEGVHFVAPEGEGRTIVSALLEKFREAGRLQKRGGQEYVPIKYSGDKNTGMRRIYILSPQTNTIKERVLIELGNFTNAKDVWRIRDWSIREDYAELIAQSLVHVNALPPWEVRD